MALASVVSSGLVAGGSLVVTYRGQKQQRKHEASQAFEARAWEEKSKTLYNVITWSRGLADSMLSQDQGVVAQSISRTMENFSHVVGGVEAYASPRARAEFAELRTALDASTIEPWLHHVLAELRTDKEGAIDAQDFLEAARLRKREREEIDQAVHRMNCDQQAVLLRCERLIEECRLSIRANED